METDYLNLLDQYVGSLVQEIEANIGSEIKIVVDSSRTEKLACDVDKCGPTIFVPTQGYFPNDSVFHELLHIRRVCLDKIPRILLCENYNGNYDGWALDPENALNLDNAIRSLDNKIEHFIIVPEELGHYSVRKSYWVSRTNDYIDSLRSLELSTDDREREALIAWAFVQNVLSDTNLTEKVNILVRDQNIEGRTQPFLDEIIRCLKVKEELVKIFVEHLHLPIEAMCLEYLDCINNTSYEVPLIEWT